MPIGDPVHGFYTWMPGRELLLMPLEPRPTEALSRVLLGDGEAITIPAEDVERFETEHLDALTRRCRSCPPTPPSACPGPRRCAPRSRSTSIPPSTT